MADKPLPIILQLQKDALDGSQRVGRLLRFAKAIAFKLDLKDALVWIDRELEGYLGVGLDDLPHYRKLSGKPEALNPMRGWQAILFTSSENLEVWTSVPITQSIISLEETIEGTDGSGSFSYSPRPAIKAAMVNALEFPTDVQISISRGALVGVIEAVRVLILNWTLALEKAGIVGGEMTFTSSDKDSAAQITHQFIIQNVGHIGDISDRAQVAIHQKAEMALDIGRITALVDQATKSLPSLPSEIRGQLESALAEIAKEIKKSSPDQGKLRSLLRSVKNMCEGASGNLIAQGIVSWLGSILG